MKVFYKVLIILALALQPLFATPKALNLGFGNDLWTFGISRNHDDGLSFSSSIIYEDTSFSSSLFYGGVTNRGCIIDEEMKRGRYDLLSLDFSYDDLSYKKNSLLASFKPKVGASVIGNLMLDNVQNFVHGSSAIASVEIPYEGGYIYSLHLGFDTEFGYVRPLENKSELVLSFGFELLSKLNFETTMEGYMKCSLLSANRHVLNFSFGYKGVKEHSALLTQKLYNDLAQGWNFSYSLRFGALDMVYKTYLDSGIGYATYSANLLSFFEKRTFQEADFHFLMLYTRVLNNSYHESAFYKSLFDSDFYIGLTNRYYSAAHLKQEVRAHGATSSYFLNLAYSYEFPYVAPFISLGCGVTNLSFVYYKDVTPDKRYDKDDTFVFSADLSAGLTILPKELLVSDNVSYSIILKGGVVMNLDEKVVRKYLSPFNPNWDNFSFLPYFSIGGVVSVDLL